MNPFSGVVIPRIDIIIDHEDCENTISSHTKGEVIN